MIPALLASYQMLRVAPWASAEEVKRAYWARAKDFHPDLCTEPDPQRAEQMVWLNRAIEVLQPR